MRTAGRDTEHMIVEENGRYRVEPNECKEHEWQYSQNRLERWCDKCRRRQLCVQVNPVEWLDVTSIGEASAPHQ